MHVKMVKYDSKSLVRCDKKNLKDKLAHPNFQT